ncbi:MAG TPA: hypothetical protein PKD54_01265 [Pirellulaceae bacterium]|nr:hypothetical protein [Pirellulaceae bacterium]
MITLITAAVVVLAGIVCYGAARVFGWSRWRAARQRVRGRLDEGRISSGTEFVNFAELEGLPPVVANYFRAALLEGQPMVTGAHLQHQGTFNAGQKRDQWKPFRSDQRVVTQRPGFDWDACIRMLPGLPVRVRDAYVAGEGILQASILGLITVANLRSSRDLAEGELMRFLAESAWYPTALLPSQGIQWREADERSAYATLRDGDVSVTLLFTFGEDGLIDTVRAESRGRMVGDKVIPTPWQGRFWNYTELGGMQVPLNGEVSWLIADSPKPYWRGHITRLVFDHVSRGNSSVMDS